MIIYSPRPGQSVALLVDGAKKLYRLRKGETVGNATVLDITQSQVTFSVEDYGNRRQEVLDLKNQKEGA
jgi:mitochondrial fission protein ELM1